MSYSEFFLTDVHSVKNENTAFYNQQEQILKENQADVNVPPPIPSRQFKRQSLVSIHTNHQGKQILCNVLLIICNQL